MVPSHVDSKIAVDPRVLDMLEERYCDRNGVLVHPLNLANCQKKLAKAFPDIASDLPEMLERMELDLNAGLCSIYPINKEGHFENRSIVAARLQEMRPDLSKVGVKKALNAIEEARLADAAKQAAAAPSQPAKGPQKPETTPLSEASASLVTWITHWYLEEGFTRTGFIGWKKFTARLVKERPSQEAEIKEMISRLRIPGSAHELPGPIEVTNARAAERWKACAQTQGMKQPVQNDQVAPPFKAARSEVSALPTLSQSSTPSSDQALPRQPGSQLQPQLSDPTLGMASMSSRSWSTVSSNNGVELADNQATITAGHRDVGSHSKASQAVNLSELSTPVKASDLTASSQAAAFESLGLSFEPSSPDQSKSVVQKQLSNKFTPRRTSEVSQSSTAESEMEEWAKTAQEDTSDTKDVFPEDPEQIQVSNETDGSTSIHHNTRSSNTRMDNTVWTAYRDDYCNEDGVPTVPLDFNTFSRDLLATHPNTNSELEAALEKFDMESCVEILRQWPTSVGGYINQRSAARDHLKALRTDLDDQASKKIVLKVQHRYREEAEVRKPTATTSATHTQVLKEPIATEISSASAKTMVPDDLLQRTSPAPPSQLPASSASASSVESTSSPNNDILTKKLKQLQASSKVKNTGQESSSPTERTAPDFQLLGQLLARRRKPTDVPASNGRFERTISQAPLLSGSTLAQHSRELVPQYGLLGGLADEDDASSSSQLFLNTNVPFSAFICGVQGSGKSHTTSCILENAVIHSPNLGHLQSPVSTLVFSYGEWSSGGAGFNISEATFLGAENPEYPGHCVRQVNVLISPSNPAIKKLYQRLPNVKIIPFRLKAQTLDIGALRTLMAVDEKSSVPLYMARVEAILRGIASESEDGSLNYAEFKSKLAQENFDPTQTNMLEMRLNLLESFLDMTGNAPEPDFQPGEITIMDLSDAFISPGTACILFKLGLERFLQSPAPGKMVVLDEAHKYMLNTPGSKVLTDYLVKVIRLQRHQGARVVISTQEPTIYTDLIALCSITVIHRFTSPAWFAALRKHINAMEDDRMIMQQIESLETGEALVYSPNAVLGKQEDGGLVKATGRLLRVNIRNRVTLDGGASIMAV